MIKRNGCLALLALLLLAGCGAADGPDDGLAFDTQVRSTDGMVMIQIPAASFKVAEEGKGGKGSHTVTLDSYRIDQTEVTNAHYARCVEDGACQAPTTCAWGEPTYGDAAFENHPVICVTWQMASSYCEWAGGRLPSEAEWDYAARGPQRSLYAWGDSFEGGNLNFCDVNCGNADARSGKYDDGYAGTSPAGAYPSGTSWCGALDMNGNVWEWVADWYAPYTGAAEENPTGPRSGGERIIRGGSWYDVPDFLRADHRHPYNPQDYNHLIGFRCATSAAEGTR